MLRARTISFKGARLVADPHPTENFFARSDNFGLAKQGIIAHTVSSFGLHADYHKPSDEIARPANSRRKGPYLSTPRAIGRV